MADLRSRIVAEPDSGKTEQASAGFVIGGVGLLGFFRCLACCSQITVIRSA